MNDAALQRFWRGTVLAAMCLLAYSAAGGPAFGDEMVDYLSLQHERRFMAANLHLARFLDVQRRNNVVQAKLVLDRRIGAVQGGADTTEYPVSVSRAGDIPEDRPVIVSARIFANRATLVPLGQLTAHQQRNPNATMKYYFDRGDPAGRYFRITMELLFPDHGQIDHDTFYERLIALTGDDDPRIAGLATSYIGSPLNVYARADCPERVIEAFVRHIMAHGGDEARAAMAPFIERSRLPHDAGIVLSLAATEHDGVTQAVVAAIRQAAHRAGQLAGPLSGALADPVSEHQRSTLLKGMLAWGRHASDYWDPLERIVTGQNSLRVTDEHIALAAELLVNIDPERAVATVRQSLAAIDSPAIYRFVYERRMYDTAGTLVEKLRRNNTAHEPIVCALLAALVRNPDAGTAARWVAWWDDLKRQDAAAELIRNQFVSPGETAVIDRLIERLADTDFAARRDAQHRLSDIGPVASPRLEAALAHADFEVAAAAEQLLAENRRRLSNVMNQLFPPQPRGQGHDDAILEQIKLMQ